MIEVKASRNSEVRIRTIERVQARRGDGHRVALV